MKKGFWFKPRHARKKIKKILISRGIDEASIKFEYGAPKRRDNIGEYYDIRLTNPGCDLKVYLISQDVVDLDGRFGPPNKVIEEVTEE